MKKLFLIILLPLLLPIYSFAQTGTIKGIVKDKITHRPLTGIVVSATTFSTRDEAITDRYGRFIIIDLNEGKYSLNFSGYVRTDTTIEDIAIKPGSEIYMDVEIITDKSPERSYKVGPDTDSDYRLREVTGVEEVSKSGMSEAAPLRPGKRGDVEPASVGEASPLAPTKSSSSEADPLMPGKSSSSESAPLRPGKSSKSEGRSEVAPKAGLLTSGEVNDFRKWELWKDISESDLSSYKSQWKLFPSQRFTVQVVNAGKMPAIDYTVRLVEPDGTIAWESRTDNTGKAELWGSAAEDEYSADIVYNNKLKHVENIKPFGEGINSVTIDEECSTPGNVDIVFAVDATGSMGDEIKYLKEELKDIISKIGAKHKDLNFKLGSIFYRDIGDDYLIRKCSLDPDISRTSDFINLQDANGGGDGPEAVELALQTAVNEVSWSQNAVARIMFLILDAPPHNNTEVKDRLKEIIARAAMDGIRIIPVTCSGIDKSTEYLMRTIALATNGTYAFLTNHSGIGGSHIEPTTDKYDVELLNALFIRLLDQFTITPVCQKQEEVAKMEVPETILNQDESKLENNSEYKDRINEIIKCYPNPTNGELAIESSEDIAEMYLADISGKLMMKLPELDKGDIQRISLSDYPTGIFFLKYQIAGNWGHYKIMLIR